MRELAFRAWNKKMWRSLFSLSLVALGLAVGMGLGLTQATRAQGYEMSGSSIVQMNTASALGADFTYQGQLKDTGNLANGLYDFQFKLYDSALNGNLVGSPDTVAVNDQQVTNGLFTVTLNFGASAFNGDARWLEVGVRPGASVAAYTALAPRQTIAAVPYALHALTAGVSPMRTFYLTNTATYNGSQALSACLPGYHMASMWEIFDLGNLRYASELPEARKLADSGFGPPLSSSGWIRTGSSSNAGAQVGVANCSVWTSSAGGSNGTQAGINPGVLDPSVNISPWDMLVVACSSTARVWCVQDYP